MYQIAILSKFSLILGEMILRRFGILKRKPYFGTNCVSVFFFKILYCIFYSSCDIFIRQRVKDPRENIGFDTCSLSGRHIEIIRCYRIQNLTLQLFDAILESVRYNTIERNSLLFVYQLTVKLFYFTWSWFKFLVVGLSVNDYFMMVLKHSFL